MAFETNTLDLCHELTIDGEKNYMKLLIDLALLDVGPSEFFLEGEDPIGEDEDV